MSVEKYKSLKLRGKLNSAIGKSIIYLQNHFLPEIELAEQTVVGRFLPFALDKNDPQFLAIAIQCAESCESWARAIREYAGLSSVPVGVPQSHSYVMPNSNGMAFNQSASVPVQELKSPSSFEVENEDDEDDEELEEQRDAEREARNKQFLGNAW